MKENILHFELMNTLRCPSSQKWNFSKLHITLNILIQLMEPDFRYQIQLRQSTFISV